MKLYYVYIITNARHTVLYTGFTNNIARRTLEHKEKLNKGFTYQYNCNKLVYYEEFNDREEALHREKQIKRYKREWKENLINSMNPEWRDLYKDFEV